MSLNLSHDSPRSTDVKMGDASFSLSGDKEVLAHVAHLYIVNAQVQTPKNDKCRMF